MKLSSIPQYYRNVNRMTEILSVLSKYGLADWLSRLQLDFAKGLLKGRNGDLLARHTRETRIRLALSELGPTFIKLGQLLSTRPDLVGTALAAELSKLQREVEADSAEVVREIVESDLGQPIEQLFDEFNEQPLASASIGQVHRARLLTGEEVVVKVQHAGIQEIVRKDLDVLTGLAELVQRLPEFAPYRPVATVAEFRRSLHRELDFGREERNLQHFSQRYQNDPTVRIPAVVSELCTPHVLTMEWIDGVKLHERDRLAQMRCDLEEVARRGAEFYLESMFTDGFYHADPHPGNILLLPGNVIALLDFGLVGRIDEGLREQLEEMLMAVSTQDSQRLATLLTRIGKVPSGLDEAAFRSDVTDFVTLYGAQSVNRIQMDRMLTEITEMIFRYRIALPPQMAMLIKVLITLEGTGKMLTPQFSLVELMQPFHRRAMLRRMSPSRQLKKFRRIYGELEHLAETLPRRIIDIFEQVQEGKFDVHLDHRGLGPSVNRLVLGLLASALYLGSALLLSLEVPPVLFRDQETFMGLHKVSILGVAGCAVSVLLGLRLLRAIGKSGHLDPGDKG